MWTINYTLKEKYKKEGASLMNSIELSSKRKIKEFLHKNLRKIYWHQIVKTNPESSHPKIIVRESSEVPSLKFSPPLEGTLGIYYETGMEGLCLTFVKDGFSGLINPDFNPSNPEDHNNFKHFGNYDALVFVDNGMILEVDGVKYFLLHDMEFAKDDGLRMSLYPRGFSKKELLEMFGPENKRARLYLRKKDKE